MVKIENVVWGKVKVNGQVFHQVLIISEQVLVRDENKLRSLFGTTHRIGDWEQKLLLSNSPEIILIARGWDGALKVEENFKKRIEKKGIGLKIVLTPEIIKEYELLTKQGKKVNCLIHTTC